MRNATSKPPSASSLPQRGGAARAGVRATISVPGEDEIYAQIRGAVIDHRLAPGTKLREVALAEVFGVKRNVVRKVLARLAYAKLVELTPNRGAAVANPTIDESRDLFSARRAVEGAIVAAATRRITATEMRKLRVLAGEEAMVYSRGDSRKGLQLSLRFHHELARIAGNRVLAEFLDQLMARTPLVVLAHRGRGNHTRCGNDEHDRIVTAIASGDADRAVAAMSAHLESLEGELDLSPRRPAPTDLSILLAPSG